MINRKPGILLIVLCLCFCLMPYHVLAASTADAVEPIITEKKCSLTLSYTCEDTAFSGAEVKLYRIAEVSADFQYMLTQPFEDSGLILNDIQTSGEWNVHSQPGSLGQSCHPRLPVDHSILSSCG